MLIPKRIKETVGMKGHGSRKKVTLVLHHQKGKRGTALNRNKVKAMEQIRNTVLMSLPMLLLLLLLLLSTIKVQRNNMVRIMPRALPMRSRTKQAHSSIHGKSRPV